MTERELGVIESTFLGHEGNGIMSFSLRFNFGGSGQSFGGWSLDGYEKSLQRRVGSKFGCEVINRILRAVGVDSWEKLVGKEMWVLRDGNKYNSKIIGIEAPAYRKGEMYSDCMPFIMSELIEELRCLEPTTRSEKNGSS